MISKSRIIFSAVFLITQASSAQFNNRTYPSRFPTALAGHSIFSTRRSPLPARQPKISGQSINARAFDIRNKKLQNKIVRYHNFFRTQVKPTATNMLRMTWHRGAQKSAQQWASACKFLTHNNATERIIQNYGACGQNIFVSTDKVPWLFAVQSWWLEKDLFTYGSTNNNLRATGHYTQMVWAATHKFGCGFAKCLSDTYNPFHRKVFYNYVCNYCPGGNRPDQFGWPYKQGKPCSSCRRRCGKNKLCLNPCYAADHWSNCQSLSQRFPAWLCRTETEEGKKRRNNCLATCFCKNKIHD